MLINYFRHSNYTTWISFKSNRSPHRIDNFIWSLSFLRQVKDCRVFKIVMRSNHTAIQTRFKITAIKSKVTEKVLSQINWKLIGYHKLTNEIFYNSLSKSIAGGTTHSNYNKRILEAGTNTVTINNNKNKVLFHFSRNSLFILIEERGALLFDYRTLGIGKDIHQRQSYD